MAALGVSPLPSRATEPSPSNSSTDEESASEDDEPSSTSKNEQQQQQQQQQQPPVKVTVFEDPTAKRAFNFTASKQDKKAFMSSKIEKISETALPQHASKSSSHQHQAADAQEEIEDRLHDQELDALLRSADFIERVATENLEGKDRRKYLQGKMVALGAKARQRGMYRHSLRRKLEEEHGVKRKAQDVVRKDRGLKMATGRYKDGALHIRSDELQSIAQEDRASTRRSRGGGGGGGGKRSNKKHRRR
ncbi:hypothetical protein SYNPS1DRAFT_31442 [Syncephalis pseudoplumigaleata]|uniref:Uncharacterized protein n=1 Tax=Syncephalis pseudoplumigaleata TaxID=1712513 RepID=A0A4P9YSY2_9FUNG|nr:hypothetical protein SYNPS1DRAFT_31442 [Syncephalis pseudoplumigaleata]|eukprot:RKP22884.1 hypothetical protein SYNPS1DRAFT_31442 [Syncephalis pseudoplumigaleata]